MTSIPTYNFNNDLVRYKYLEQLDKTPERPNAKTRALADKYVLRRSRSRMVESNGEKIKAAVGAFVGTVIPMAMMMKNH